MFEEGATYFNFLMALAIVVVYPVLFLLLSKIFIKTRNDKDRLNKNISPFNNNE